MQTITRERGFFGVWRGATVIGAGCVAEDRLRALFLSFLRVPVEWNQIDMLSKIVTYVETHTGSCSHRPLHDLRVDEGLVGASRGVQGVG